MDLSRAGVGSLERDVEQAIIALKKGSQLLKYARRGRPKFCPFRLSNDETTLIWFSGRKERQVRLDCVTRIIPGQRTANFQRYPRPEKEYQSFSLIYGSDDKSLDLICKDKDEAEVWFVALKARISSNLSSKLDSKSEGTLSETNSPIGRALRDSPLLTSFDTNSRSPYGSPSTRNLLHKTVSAGALQDSLDHKQSVESDSTTGSLHSLVSDESLNAQSKSLSLVEAFRVSMSSAVSSSSGGEDGTDALGDVFIWGEGAGEGFLGGGLYKLTSGAGIAVDALSPKALHSAVVLDVSGIACGSRHAALVTRQGDVFCWGEEFGGRLGHGIDADVSEPQLLQTLTGVTMELVACGEFHTCGVSTSGELYTWGAGTQSIGLLGHGNAVSHWMPKRMNAPLEGVRVSSVACGAWHTALVTSSGQLFTFGDGTFGVLGHGDKRNVYMPKEVESLKGLKTVGAACGLWHTAAVVEVIVGYSTANACSSGKLFTWGDGDKYRLGHGDKEHRLVPTCVAALVDYNFRQVACGHSITVALTTSGRVFTMGSSIYGQLGNPKVDGKIPGMVEDELSKVFVEQIDCGAHHVTALTLKSELYTWGKGANGRLGHGDVDDRTTPTMVDGLKDKQVRSVTCGSSFTMVICLHKPVSDADLSVCSGCKQTFGFTRKRHNCYNCGFAFCHSCSSRKAFKASLAPNPSKAHRVCDPCFTKLERLANESVARKNSGSTILSVKPRPNVRSLMKPVDVKQTPGLFNDGAVQSRPLGHQTSFTIPEHRVVSRSASPLPRRPSPPRSATPTPTSAGLAPPVHVVQHGEELKKRLEMSRQEVVQLKAQISALTNRYEAREKELQRGTHRVQEAVLLAGEETAKCRAAKEVIKSLTAELKELAERVPSTNKNGRHLETAVAAATAEIEMKVAEGVGSNNSSSESRAQQQERQEQEEEREEAEKEKVIAAEEWVEQDQPGVYITLATLPSGARDLKRVRFSRRRFSEKEAEQWWQENRQRVHQHYNIKTSNRTP